MFVANQRLDQLSAAQTDFKNRFMLSGVQPNEVLRVFIFPGISLHPNFGITDSERNGNHEGSLDIPLAQISILNELITDLDVLAEVTLTSKSRSSCIVRSILFPDIL